MCAPARRMGSYGDRGYELLTSDKGAAAVEFALVLPLLVVLIFAIVEFSILMFDKAVITNASREGARAGIVYRADPTAPPGESYDPLTCDQITEVVDDYISANLITFGSSGAAAATSCSASAGCSGSGVPLVVTVTYDYTFLVLPNVLELFESSALGSALTLTAVTNMTCE